MCNADYYDRSACNATSTPHRSQRFPTFQWSHELAFLTLVATCRAVHYPPTALVTHRKIPISIPRSYPKGMFQAGLYGYRFALWHLIGTTAFEGIVLLQTCGQAHNLGVKVWYDVYVGVASTGQINVSNYGPFYINRN